MKAFKFCKGMLLVYLFESPFIYQYNITFSTINIKQQISLKDTFSKICI